jgi:hypothetical protein
VAEDGDDIAVLENAPLDLLGQLFALVGVDRCFVLVKLRVEFPYAEAVLGIESSTLEMRFVPVGLAAAEPHRVENHLQAGC